MSRNVAHDAATRAGLAPSLMKKMPPMVAKMDAAYMTERRTTPARSQRKARRGNPLESILGMAGTLRRR